MKKNYTVKVRRKREQKTDYKSRLKLVASNKPRFVVRRMLNNILVQIVTFDENGDKTLVSAHSRELIKFGWKAHRGSIPSAYLTGMIAGFKAKKNGVKEAILDIGLMNSVKSSSLFAALKGGVDAGLIIPCSNEKLPSDDALSGKLIENYAKALLKEDKQIYDRQFSKLLKLGIKPEELNKHFEEIKRKVKTKWQ